MRPRRTISAVENALSTSFCAVPAFSRVEPEIDLGADRHLDDVVGAAGELGAGGADDRAGQRLRRRGERAERVRGAPAGGDGDDHVLAARAERATAAAPASASSSAAASSSEPAGCSAPATSAVGGLGERRAELHRVDEREPAGRARAGVDQPPAVAEPRGGGVGRARRSRARPPRRRRPRRGGRARRRRRPRRSAAGRGRTSAAARPSVSSAPRRSVIVRAGSRGPGAGPAPRGRRARCSRRSGAGPRSGAGSGAAPARPGVPATCRTCAPPSLAQRAR